MKRFSNVIEELRLKNLPLSGDLFSWCGGLNSQAASRLDCFLVFDEWEDHFSGISHFVLPRLSFDHCLIILDGEGVKKMRSFLDLRICGL